MKKLFTLFAAALILASCSKEDNPVPAPSGINPGTTCTSVQCTAIGAKGRCQRTTTNCDGQCHRH